MPVSTIPRWEGFTRPILEVLSDGTAWRKKEFELAVLDHVGITPEQRLELLPAGDSRALNRIGWATSFLARADAISKPQRGVYQIADVGRTLLAEGKEQITQRRLKQTPAWSEYEPTRGRRAVASGEANQESIVEVDDDPIELIEAGIATIEDEVSATLIENLRNRHPDFFEQAVVDVLVAMGYGGTDNRGRRLGGSGDGGVDGVIDQDALGLNRIYVQAKRYAEGNTVQRPDLQGFVGALADKGASQGVFVTTSAFSVGAREYAERVPGRIVLIDGDRLAKLMIRYRVGVQMRKTYALVEVDEDYFE